MSYDMVLQTGRATALFKRTHQCLRLSLIDNFTGLSEVGLGIVGVVWKADPPSLTEAMEADKKAKVNEKGRKTKNSGESLLVA